MIEIVSFIVMKDGIKDDYELLECKEKLFFVLIVDCVLDEMCCVGEVMLEGYLIICF